MPKNDGTFTDSTLYSTIAVSILIGIRFLIIFYLQLENAKSAKLSNVVYFSSLAINILYY